MSIEKRPTGDGYTVRWRDTAGRQRKKKVTLWRDAVALDGEMKRKKAMGELVVHERGTVALEDFWLLWLERYGNVHITARTLDNYQRLWSVHVEPKLGRYRLRDLTPEHIADLTAQLSKTLSASSVRKVLAVLQGVLQRAVEWQYIGTNVAVGIRKPRVQAREGQALTADQLTALIDELPNIRSKIIVRVLAGTGIRPGELRALRWGDVGETLTIRGAVSRNQIGPTKTYGRRSVVLTGDAAKALQEWRLARGRLVRPGALVFPAAQKDLVWADDAWRLWQRRAFTPAAKRAGLPGLVPYDLRHTFVSRLIAEGRDIYWIARQAGHSPYMALNTYGHLLEERYTSTEPVADSLVVDLPVDGAGVRRLYGADGPRLD